MTAHYRYRMRFCDGVMWPERQPLTTRRMIVQRITPSVLMCAVFAVYFLKRPDLPWVSHFLAIIAVVSAVATLLIYADQTAWRATPGIPQRGVAEAVSTVASGPCEVVGTVRLVPSNYWPDLDAATAARQEHVQQVKQSEGPEDQELLDSLLAADDGRAEDVAR